MAGGKYTDMAASDAASVVNALKPTPQSLACSELRAGGGDTAKVIANQKRIQADPACRRVGPKGP